MRPYNLRLYSNKMMGEVDMAGSALGAAADQARFMGRLLLAQATVDLDVERRGEQGLLERLLGDATTRVMLIDLGKVAVPRREVADAPEAFDCTDDPAAPRPDATAPSGLLELAMLSPADLRVDGDVARLAPYVIYLGMERSEDGGGAGASTVSYLALDVARAARAAGDAGAAGSLCAGASDERRRGGQALVSGETPRRPSSVSADGAASLVAGLAARLRASYGWIELRAFAPCASARDAGLATSAVAVAMWHDQQRYCPACGSPVVPALSGWAQTCSSPDDADRLLFPRIEPAIITAIVDDADRILLQNNAAWRRRFFSVSAGFVEAGESLEHAVRREAAEEVGVELDRVWYLGSQPWPFPASIMLGFRAHARTTTITPDHSEVASARWFTRDELRQAVESGGLELPGRASIARHLIEDWFGGQLG